MFYGWVVVGIGALSIMMSMGMWFSFTVFYVEILKEFGWSRAATAGVFTVYALMHGFASPFVGMAVRRWGSRVVVCAGSLTMVLGLVLSSRTSAVWHLFLFYGCITAIGGAAMGYPPHSALVANWFSRRRGLALGIVFAGTGLGIIVIPKLSQYLIDVAGWRSAYLSLTLLLLLLVLPLNFFFSRYRPEQKGLTMDGLPPQPEPPRQATAGSSAEASREWTVSTALRSRQFWMVAIAYVASSLTIQLVMVHQFAFLTDLGMTRSFAAGVISAIGIFNICGQLTGGSLCDRSGSEVAQTAHAVLIVAALLALLGLSQLGDQTGSGSYVYLYPFLWGIGTGGTGMIVVVACADIFQGPNFAAIVGYHSLGWGLGGGMGAIIAGWIHDMTNSYQSAFALAILVNLLSVAALWLAAPRLSRRARASAAGERA